MRGKVGNGGFAEGEAIVAKKSLSFWGSFNILSGKIEDEHHDLNGKTIAGKILVMPSTAGSPASEEISYHAGLLHTWPIAILSNKGDPTILSGAMLANIPYLFDFGRDITKAMECGDAIEVDGDEGIVRVKSKTVSKKLEWGNADTRLGDGKASRTN